MTLINQEISTRLNEISKLDNGWYEEEGFFISKNKLNWILDIFKKYYPSDYPIPFFYPTVEGGLQIEWNFNDEDISLIIDFSDNNGFLHILNLITGESTELNLNFNNDDSWINVFKTIKDRLI